MANREFLANRELTPFTLKQGPAEGRQSEWGQEAALAPFPGFCLKTVLVKDDQVRQLELLNQ